jgi:hypothetical protein
MKHILNDLSDEEKNSIREQHTGGKELFIENFNTLANNKLGNVKPLVEQNEGGHGESSRAGETFAGTGKFTDNLKYNTKKPYHFGKDKMKTGSDEVDVNTPEYKNLVTKLKSLLIDPTFQSGTPLTVLGGASDVGTSSGYDNKALAKRRADKFIAKLKFDIPGVEKKFKLNSLGVVGKPLVAGKETKKDSPKAYADQFVNVSFTEPSTAIQKASYEVDNMVGYNAKIYPPIKKDGGEDYGPTKMKRVCIQIPETYLDEYLEMIKQFKLDNSLPKIKYGVYDIK